MYMENNVEGLEDESTGTNTIFDDDDLDTAVASADDTGMISQRQYVVESEEALVDEEGAEPM